MKKLNNLKTYENFRNSKNNEFEEINEFFGLGKKLKNWASKAVGGNIAKIEKAVQNYEEEYEKALKLQQDSIEKMNPDDEQLSERLKKLRGAAEKKKKALEKNLNSTLKKLSTNQREKEFAEMTKSESEMRLIDKEIEMFQSADIESEEIKNLVDNLSDKREKEEKDAKESAKKMKALQDKADKTDGDKLEAGKEIVYTRKDGTENKAKISDNQEDIEDNMIRMKSLDNDNEFVIKKDNIKKAE